MKAVREEVFGRISPNSAESSEEKIQQILDRLVQMNEQYQYILCQLQNQQEDEG